MLRSTIRFVSLMAVVLFALVTVGQSILFLRTEAQEPTKTVAADATIKQLQRQRFETAEKLARQQMMEFQERHKRGNVVDVLESNRLLMDARLEVCAKPTTKPVSLP